MPTLNRRQFLARTGGALAPVALAGCATIGGRKGSFRLATFTADVTVPLGHALMGGGIAPAREIVDPLLAHGFVLLDAGSPVVVVAVDWCEIRNDAYERWRTVLGKSSTEFSRSRAGARKIVAQWFNRLRAKPQSTGRPKTGPRLKC